MKTSEELFEWCSGAEQTFGDPAVPIGLVFLRYVPTVSGYDGADLVATSDGDALVVRFAPEVIVRLNVSEAGPEGDDEQLRVFGLSQIAPGLWSLCPSLHLPGFLHAWVVLYDVPVPAPWGKRIVLADGTNNQIRVP